MIERRLCLMVQPSLLFTAQGSLLTMSMEWDQKRKKNCPHLASAFYRRLHKRAREASRAAEDDVTRRGGRKNAAARYNKASAFAFTLGDIYI